MTVRNALLGILTLGPAYGLQLHFELGDRAPHRKTTNVGQIYATIERHTTAGLIESAGETSEGLPLYQLTSEGSHAAAAWLSGSNIVELPAWEDLLDHVLIANSVDATRATEVSETIARIAHSVRAGVGNPGATLSESAQARYAEAVTAWIGDVQHQLGQNVHGYVVNRPKRGRPRKTA